MQIDEKHELKTVHVNDLDEILKSHGQLEEFRNGEINCIICNSKISNENVGSLQLNDNKLLFSCNKSSCYDKLIEKE